jgi:hypothetical protein
MRKINVLVQGCRLKAVSGGKISRDPLSESGGLMCLRKSLPEQHPRLSSKNASFCDAALHRSINAARVDVFSSEIVAIKKIIVKMKEVNWVEDFECG